MKFLENKPARSFHPTPAITLHDFGSVTLENDEQVTLVFGEAFRNDVTAKSWGAYLTNSINVNLRERGLRVALTLSQMNGTNKTFICLVREDSVQDFLTYLNANDTLLVVWLDEVFASPHA